MHFDFSAALTLATLVTGVIAGIYWFLKQRKKVSSDRKEPLIVEYSKSFSRCFYLCWFCVLL